MKIYLVRHGTAAAAELDPERGLNDRGRREAAATAALLKAIGVKPAQVIHSGKKRAAQTAEILAGVIAPGVSLQTAKGMAPLDTPGRIAAAVPGWTEDTMLVGHMPFMSGLLSLLCAGDESAFLTDFTTAGAACVESDNGGGWVLRFVVGPEMA